MDEFTKIYLIAGEASGDLLGAQLMKALKKQSEKPIRFFGVGGERMSSEGIASLFPYQELSMLGFLEVLPHAMNVFARVDRTVEDIIAKEPSIVVTIDVPGFNLRVAKKLRKLGFKGKLIHYVAPTVWAYKPQRAKLCAELFDHMLVLLLSQRFPKLAIGMTVPKHILPLLAPFFEKCPFRAIVTADPADKYNLFAASQGAIVKSGTVALEVAKAGIPMVVPYKVNPISAYLLRRVALTRFVNLVNILAGKEVFPELLQELCTPHSIADSLYGLMTNESLSTAQKTEASAALLKLIAPNNILPSDAAANVVLANTRS